MICRSTLRAWSFRMLAVVLAGVTGYIVGDQAGPLVLGQGPELWMYALAVAVPAVLTFFTARSLAVFTDSFLGIPAPGVMAIKGGNDCAVHRTVAPAAPEACARTDAPKTPFRLPTFAKATNFLSFPVPQETDEPSLMKASCEAYGILVQNDKLTIEAIAPGEDGLATVSITTTGLSNTQLKGNAKGNKKSTNGLVNQLHNIPGVRWSAHKNVGEGKKQIVGTISAEKRQTAFAPLVELANRYKS